MNSPRRSQSERGLGGTVHPVVIGLIGSLVVAVGLVGLLAWEPHRGDRADAPAPLIVHCAAGVKLPIEELAQNYERDHGVPIRLQFGGSNTLLSQLAINRTGDLYLPADEFYIALAREKNLVSEAVPLARMHLVAIVSEGNPRGIRSLDDLKSDDIELSQANPDAAASGFLARAALIGSGDWGPIRRRTRNFTGTVTEVITDVRLGAVDAGIGWDVLVPTAAGVDAVAIPQLTAVNARVAAGVLADSDQPDRAMHFAKYLADRETGLPVFRRYGFANVEQPDSDRTDR